MLPACLTPAEVWGNKVREYRLGLSGDHRPNVTLPHLSVPKRKQTHKQPKQKQKQNKNQNQKVVPNTGPSTAIQKHKTVKGEEVTNPHQAPFANTWDYFTGPGGLPTLTIWQAQLYGLLPYDEPSPTRDPDELWEFVPP
mmetsp:Transcript_52380/g.63130  ORF Transcript_52380/g.63130 Transcript_52380/m.63130 type:complete len:139 (-) Transcript_52380:2401-2817(-)